MTDEAAKGNGPSIDGTNSNRLFESFNSKARGNEGKTCDEKYALLVEKLASLRQNQSVRKLHLPKINHQLEDIIKQTEAISSLEKSDIILDYIEPLYRPMANEKLDHQ